MVNQAEKSLSKEKIKGKKRQHNQVGAMAEPKDAALYAIIGRNLRQEAPPSTSS